MKGTRFSLIAVACLCLGALTSCSNGGSSSVSGLHGIRRGATFGEKVVSTLDWMGFEGLQGSAQEMAERERYNLR